MADIDLDSFGGAEQGRKHDRPEENIPPVILGERRVPTWEPEREQGTSFGGPVGALLHGGESQRTKLMKDYIKDLYRKLSENIDETPEPFHYDYFKLKGGELYYIDNRRPLTTEEKLKSVGMIADILGKNRLRRLGFNIPVGKITAREAVMLNKVKKELPSESDITKADDI